MKAYYNEIDKDSVQWLKTLISEGCITNGDVDDRSIEDVQPKDLAGYDRIHFFAGAGVWDYALTNANWPKNVPVWTGSCPCQPFSAAGKGAGFADERHLWPAFHHLIKECRPATVFGEQVSGVDSQPWLDLVQNDMEALDYAFGSLAFPACSVGAPKIRERLYWVGNSNSQGSQRHIWNDSTTKWQRESRPTAETSVSVKASQPGPVNGFWRDADWLLCRDRKWRAVQPGSFPLADGPPARVVRLRGYGNAINAEAAKFFIKSVM
jgi:DNA (cytosine-5)-methyltransferase 1